MTNNFDAIVIGAGQAGPSMAGRLTDAGMTVAVVERRLIGGTCVNTGCSERLPRIFGSPARPRSKVTEQAVELGPSDAVVKVRRVRSG